MIDPLSISIIIINWNSKDDLSACILSLLSQTDHDFKIIVVDNGSTDGSVELIKSKYPSVELIETNQNLGFAEGCNRGIINSRGSWVAIINNDAIADPDWIRELRNAAKNSGSDIGMIQSKIVFLQKPDYTNSTGVLVHRDANITDRGYNQRQAENETIEEVFCVSAGAAMYRRKMLDEIRLKSGFFDRTFFMYFEDVDLGWRGRLAGWSAVYVPTAVVRHAFHAAANRRGQFFAAILCNQNRVRVFLKNASISFLFKNKIRFCRELKWCIRTGGWKTILKYLLATKDGLSQRREVARLSTISRHMVEKRWVVD